MKAHTNKRGDYLWEILVPTISNDGKQVAGGLTITPPVKGQWIGFNKDLFTERNIPVRIMCNKVMIYNGE